MAAQAPAHSRPPSNKRARLPVQEASARLDRFFRAATEMMVTLSRASGHARLADLGIDDLTTFDREMHHLTGVSYAGVTA